MNIKQQHMILILLGLALVAPALADEDDRRRLFLVPAGRRPLLQLLRPVLAGPGGVGRPLVGGGPLAGLGGAANAAGAGNGAVIGNQAIGTGTGIANAGPGGFGVGLGIGLAVATPIGNFAIGEGQSIAIGK